jgi:antitoxin FitA
VLHYVVMSKSITIRNVPDETTEELAARAALTGRSLQEYLRARLVELAGAPDAEVWMARVRARKAVTGGSVDVARILAHRDADRA